jgi:PPM family protein phosphatase
MNKKLTIKRGNHSDVGMKRKINQDDFGTASNEWGDIFVLADGMGGYKGGEIASSIAVKTICDGFKKADSEIAPVMLLDELIKEAHYAILEQAKQNPSISDMGTTVIAVIIKDTLAYVGHVGDSRCYLFRNNNAKWISKDHSFVQDLLRKGLINEAEARNHPNKNRILQALGSEKIKPSYETLALKKGDKFLLSSDGLHGEVEWQEMIKIMNSNEPMEASHKLVDLANERGGPDNITVITIYIEPAEPETGEITIKKTEAVQPQQKRKHSPKQNLFSKRNLSYILLVLILLMIVNKCHNPKKDDKKKEKSETTAIQIADSSKAESDSSETQSDSLSGEKIKSLKNDDPQERESSEQKPKGK